MGFVLAGIFAGIMSGVAGVGGGFVVVPMLVFFFGFTIQAAQGTTLALLSMPVCAMAAWSYYQRGHTNPKVALILAVGFLIGSLFGAKIAGFISEDLSRKIFAGLLAIIAIKMFMQTTAPQ